MQICPRCGTVIRDGSTECSWCKAPLASKITPPPVDLHQVDLHQTAEEVTANRRPIQHVSPRTWLTLFLLSAGCLAVAVVFFGTLGVYQGTRDKAFENRRAAVVHYQKGLEYLRADRKELAAAEFREAERLIPGFTLARQALKVVESQEGDIQGIPTMTPAATVLAVLFSKGKSLYQNKQWKAAAQELEALVGAAPDYHRGEVQSMLFDSHMQAGLAAAQVNHWDDALRQFDQALAIRPDDPEALRQRRYAETYREGDDAWGKAWDRVVLAFGRLYSEAPGYHDVAVRLREARIQYGNVFYKKRIWCQAAEQYQAAIQLAPQESTADMKKRSADAQRRCTLEKQRAAATRIPTALPGATPTPTSGTPATGYTFVMASRPTPDYSRGCSGHYIYGEVRNGAGELLAGVHVRAVDAWGNPYENVSKAPPDQGKYDIPLGVQATTYQVTIVDKAGTPLSAAVTITDTGRFVNGSESCWHRLDWRQK